MEEQFDHMSWIEINEENLLHNIDVFKKHIGDNILLGVVLKSNAYGHGFPEILECVHDEVDIIHVISPEDAFYIRNYELENALKQVRILVLGAVIKDHLEVCAEHDIELVMYGHDWDVLLNDQKFEKKIKAHLHIDTGLGREGFEIDGKELQALLKKHEEKIEVIGVMSHFANIEDVTEQEYANKQIENFNIFMNSTNLNAEKHIGASAATLILKDSHFDAVRIGISLYGMWPSKDNKLSYSIISKDKIEFKPVLSWKVKSQIVKIIKAGSYIGYGCTHKCESDTRIAVLPIGYYDGYPRSLSGKAYTLVEGQRCPVLGRIMMNHIVIDISNTQKDNKRITATLIGIDQNETVTAENIASWSNTINYEATTRISGHLPRVII